MIEINNEYYNAKDIRRLNRNNRGNLVITFTNGDIEHTDYYYDDYDLDELLKDWVKVLEDKK